MTLIVTTPPAALPVTVAEAKAHLRVTTDSEDALIAGLITAARDRVEAELGLALIATGFRETFDRPPPDGVIALSRAPLISVAEVAVSGPSGWAARDPSSYLARLGGRVAEVAPLHTVWPIPFPPIEGFRVDYTAGFGAGADAVPKALVQALLVLIADGFDHRGDGAVIGSVAPAEPWLAPFRRVRL